MNNNNYRRRRRGAITLETLDAPVQEWLATVRSVTPQAKDRLNHRDRYGRRGAICEQLQRFDLASLGFDFRAHADGPGGLEALFQTMLERVGRHQLPPAAVASFAAEARALYHDDVPYHNFEHAFDVAQACFHLLCATAAGRLLDGHAQAALLVAALLHDAGHGGRSNAFLAASDDPLAARFGPHGTLEKLHARTATRLLDRGSLLGHMDERDAARFVRDVEDCILATDMGAHLAVGALRDHVRAAEEAGEELPRGPARSALLALLLRTADISNVARPMELSRFWARRLERELRAQADAELALGLPGMRPAASTAAMVTGFVDAVAAGAFQTVADVLPGADRVRDAVARNREEWGLRPDLRCQ